MPSPDPNRPQEAQELLNELSEASQSVRPDVGRPTKPDETGIGVGTNGVGSRSGGVPVDVPGSVHCHIPNLRYGDGDT